MMAEDIISQLLAARSGAAVSPTISSATTSGLSRTDLSALLSPQLLVGTGLVGTGQLSAGLQEYYNKLIEDELARFAKDQAAAAVTAGPEPVAPRVPQASAVAGNIANKWSEWTAREYPNLADSIATLISQAGSGAGGADAVDALMARLGSMDKNAAAVLGPNIAELKSDLETVKSEGIDFASRMRKYNEDLADFEDEKKTYQAKVDAIAGTVAPVSTPDMGSAWAEYAKEIGVPGLGSLPSPLETYQFTPEDVRAVRKPTQKGTTMNLLETMLQRRGQARRPVPRPTGLPPMSAGPEVLQSGQGPRSAITASEQANAARMLERQAMERRAAMDPLDIMAQGYKMMAESKARSLGRQAQASGRSPLQDALNEMIKYGVLEASQ